MKNLILIVALSVTCLLSAKNHFSSVEIKNFEKVESKARPSSLINELKLKPIQECGIYINYYDDFGFISRTEYRSSEQSTLSDCQKWQEVQKLMLMEEGYFLTPY